MIFFRPTWENPALFFRSILRSRESLILGKMELSSSALFVFTGHREPVVKGRYDRKGQHSGVGKLGMTFLTQKYTARLGLFGRVRLFRSVRSRFVEQSVDAEAIADEQSSLQRTTPTRRTPPLSDTASPSARCKPLRDRCGSMIPQCSCPNLRRLEAARVLVEPMYPSLPYTLPPIKITFAGHSASFGSRFSATPTFVRESVTT